MSNPNLVEAGKPYRWKKGQSGNPTGRPSRLPISDRLRVVLEMRLPEPIRRKLETAIGQPLPKNLTFGDGYALAMFLETLGTPTGFRVDIAREIREAVEGKATQRIEMAPEEPMSQGEIKRGLWQYLIELAIDRSTNFNMALPAITALADEAGVDLGIKREEKSEGGSKPQ